jgi:hypothetical protein
VASLLLLLQVGTRALQGNMTKLGPKVLPISEQLLFAGEAVIVMSVLLRMQLPDHHCS